MNISSLVEGFYSLFNVYTYSTPVILIPSYLYTLNTRKLDDGHNSILQYWFHEIDIRILAANS